MQLTCRACGKPIPADDVNIDKAIAKCRACNAVFGFADSVSGGRGPLVRPQIATPTGFVVDNWGPELAITRRWYSHGLWFLLFFCIVWDGFLVVWYSIALGGLVAGKAGFGNAGFGDWGFLIMAVFPLLHVLVGVGLTYAVLCGFLNKTWIRVSVGELSIRHGPLPTGRNKQVLTTNLKQLYCTENKHHGKHGCRFTYDLQALLASGEKLKLLSNLEDLDQALFLEQQIEKHLRIADERVAGEVGV